MDDGVPPDPPQPYDQNDWTPYSSCLQFEAAEFLYQQNKMSAGHIDHLLQLWHASLVQHGDHAPFLSHKDLYNTIDATAVGGVPWESFTLSYNGTKPEQNVPEYMNGTYTIYYRDPRELVLEMLDNTSFVDDFDYIPVRNFTTEEIRQYEHFMSGNWAWKQAV